MSIDLDINNYDYKDLLNIFKIENTYNDENISKMKHYCMRVKETHSNGLFIFYYKAYKIIACVYYLFKNNIISSLSDFTKIETYLVEIKQITSFENYKTEDLFELFLRPTIKESSEISLDDTNKIRHEKYNLESKKTTTNQVISTFSNSVAPGELNSIKRVTLSQNLNLNSCFRNNYFTSTSTDFQYMIPCEIKNVVSLRLASIEIPNAWYLFSDKHNNNKFVLAININGILEKYEIVIPEGNYDNENLQEFLNNSYFYKSHYTNGLQYIRFSIDPFNFKTHFDVVGSPNNFSFSLIFSENANNNPMINAGWLLGFRLPTYINITDDVRSEGLFDGGGDRYIYFILEDYQYNNNSTNIVCFDKSTMEDNILAKIPIVNGKLSLIIDDNNNPLTKTRKYNGPINLRKLHIKVLDKFGDVINLNNMDFSFTLEVEILYESFNFKDILV
jgi:hypothetical protein